MRTDSPIVRSRPRSRRGPGSDDVGGRPLEGPDGATSNASREEGSHHGEVAWVGAPRRAARFHADRAPRGHRHHRGADRTPAAGRPGGARGGPAGPVRQQPQADRPGVRELRERQHDLSAGRHRVDELGRHLGLGRLDGRRVAPGRQRDQLGRADRPYLEQTAVFNSGSTSACRSRQAPAATRWATPTSPPSWYLAAEQSRPARPTATSRASATAARATATARTSPTTPRPPRAAAPRWSPSAITASVSATTTASAG